MPKFVLALAFCVLTAVSAAPKQLTPVVPEADGYIEIPQAALKPDPALSYRMVFDARRGAEKPGELAPAINLAAAELNTFVAAKVPTSHFKIAVVFHGRGADDALLDDAHYKTKFGVANPNLKPLAEMHRGGVALYVCGEQLTADGIDFKWLSPDVRVAADGLLALTIFQNRGYAVLVF